MKTQGQIFNEWFAEGKRGWRNGERYGTGGKVCLEVTAWCEGWLSAALDSGLSPEEIDGICERHMRVEFDA